MSTSPPIRDHVFVSYSHKDVAWLDLLTKELAPDIRNRRIDCRERGSTPMRSRYTVARWNGWKNPSVRTILSAPDSR
jgi:hypothetical protein